MNKEFSRHRIYFDGDFEYKNIEGYVSFYSKGVINIEIFDYNTGSIIFNTLLMPEDDSTEAFNQFDKLI